MVNLRIKDLALHSRVCVRSNQVLCACDRKNNFVVPIESPHDFLHMLFYNVTGREVNP
jgi:hypothetical protein